MDVTRKNGTWMDLRGIDSKLLGCIEPYILQSNIGVVPLDAASEDYFRWSVRKIAWYARERFISSNDRYLNLINIIRQYVMPFSLRNDYISTDIYVFMLCPVFIWFCSQFGFSNFLTKIIIHWRPANIWRKSTRVYFSVHVCYKVCFATKL